MLILSRNKGESIVICDEQYNVIAKITIVDVRGNKVRLGIEADKKYPIHRREVYEAIQKEKAEQAKNLSLNNPQICCKLFKFLKAGCWFVASHLPPPENHPGFFINFNLK